MPRSATASAWPTCTPRSPAARQSSWSRPPGWTRRSAASPGSCAAPTPSGHRCSANSTGWPTAWRSSPASSWRRCSSIGLLARRTDQRPAAHGGGVGGRRDSRGPSGRHRGHVGDRRLGDGAAARDREATRVGGDPRLRPASICSDKTGTLTLNEMTAVELITQLRPHAVTGAGYCPHRHRRAPAGRRSRCDGHCVHRDGAVQRRRGPRPRR